MVTEYDREEILRLKEGCEHEIDLGAESGAEIWLKNGVYFLFSWPQGGGDYCFEESYRLNSIEEMIKEIESWT